MLLDKYAYFPRRDVESITRVDIEPIELIASEFGVKEAAVRTSEFEPHHRTRGGYVLEHGPQP
jgi:hypothetical protein